ncbi:MAG: quinolinate synthase NadA [Dehalococcoidia bacterium]|nr:quinolinate synthase NadA [Dehalococcoidia bacterium]
MNSTLNVIQRINSLKQDRRAIILAHNYQPDVIQDIADFVGDSLELSQQAACNQADVIVFCGVHFMAETAYILSPQKSVLLPDSHAGCPMADMISAEELRAKKQELPQTPVVCYVNSSAAVKAESDICCTSANAVKVVQSLTQHEILFVPDKYLGQWVSSQTSKKLHMWPGFCPTHSRIQPQHIIELKARYPEAKVMVHPECPEEISALADTVPSTSGMLRYAKQSDARQFIVGTEIGIIHRLQKEAPGKEFIPVTPHIVCPNMKLTTLDKVLQCLEDMQPLVTVPEDIRSRAYTAVRRMLQVG